MSRTYRPHGLSPLQIISAYSSEEWEQFIEEWMYGFEVPYHKVERLAGSGDMGRDVVGYVGDPTTPCEWDNYQCKHYSAPLSLGKIWPELGKLCYYTYRQEYTVPRIYRFVAPREVSTHAKHALKKPIQLQDQLIASWDKSCRDSITEKESVDLQGEFRRYVENFDFSIVGYITLAEVILQHGKTRFFSTRFKQDVPLRPSHPIPPEQVEQFEAKYVTQLLRAYGDASGEIYHRPDDLTKQKAYQEHFRRSRDKFFQAEGLNRFSRDNFPPVTFESVKSQVYDGVVDTASANHANGFERVLATTKVAASLSLSQVELGVHAEVGDKIGICHHLANEDKLVWVKK